MSIKSINILNVLVFGRQLRKNNGDTKVQAPKAGDTLSDGFHLDFIDGINVLIGENGVGKTSVLKMIYSATQWSWEKKEPGKTKRLMQFFSGNIQDSEALKNMHHADDYCYYKVSDGVHDFEESLSHNGIFNFDEWLGLNIPAVFIPSTEMLSHSRNFLAMNNKYNLPFDGTQVDIIVNASLPTTKEITPVMRAVLEKISKVIEGTVVQEDDAFYVLKDDGRKIDFSLEAEGLRKLGLLWKLIRNGLLEAGSILLWDEPEANLNPELYPLVAEILIELQKYGVQIFIATHSYNFAKYLEIRRMNEEQVVFHNLYKGNSEIADIFKPMEIFENDDKEIAVYSSSAYRMEDVVPNHIMIADEKLLNEVYDMRG